MHFSTLLSIAGFVNLCIAGYTLEDDFTASTFFSLFNFTTENDPTGGYVNYVSQSEAQGAGMINTNNGQVYMGVDHNNVASGRGRSSLRLESFKTYNHALVVLDLANMPGGICGTWPAFWMFNNPWPNMGEIDIIEGVNDQASNSMTLHTTDGCIITPPAKSFLGTQGTPDCNVDSPTQAANAGCGFSNNNSTSYGTGFNSNGGGVYAMEWTSSAISIWFFPRNNIPSDVLGAAPNPAGWGTPTSLFQGNCNIDQHFTNLKIVFDNTFCGSWAGAVWGGNCAAQHGGSCNAFVQNTPSAFQNAFWSVNALKVYTAGSTSSTTANPADTAASQPIPVAPLVASPVAPESTTTSVTTVPPVTVIAPAVTVIANAAVAAPTPTTLVAQPSPVSASESSEEFLTFDDFGSGSPGIPVGSEGKAKRRRRHLDSHRLGAKGHS